MKAPARANGAAIAYCIIGGHFAMGAWPLFGIHPCAGILAALFAVVLILLAIGRRRFASAYRFQP
jgi:hypothetical protein